MFPAEKDHFTEVYLCLLLHHAAAFSSPQSPFLWVRPYRNQGTVFVLCWAPSKGNTCSSRKPKESFYFYLLSTGAASP